MAKRVKEKILFNSREELEALCIKKELNTYETEIIIRKCLNKQTLDYIADTMDFLQHGKTQKNYSRRSVINFYNEAFLKLNK